MTTYYIRGSIIWLNYYVDGVRKQKSTKLKNTLQNIKIVTSQIIPALDAKIASGEIYKKKSKTFNYYGSIYLKQKIDDKNYFKMRGFYNIIESHFNNIDIDNINRFDIKEYLNSLTIKSKNPYKTVLIAIFELAVDDGVIDINPALNIRLGSFKKKEVEYFTKDEVKRIMDAVPYGLLKVYLMIAFNTGLRSGEILGLQIGDFEENHINVKRTRTLGVIGTGKTNNAIRKVPYPSYLLNDVKRIQSNNIFIFGDIDDSSKLNYQWYKYISIAMVKRLRLYCTRHTYATLMLQDKVVSINELTGILGHSSVKTTLDKYASAIQSDSINLDSNFSLFSDEMVTLSDSEQRKTL
ncbi:tyrosine-type recombinase/integrase [Sulfurimonas sp.]